MDRRLALKTLPEDRDASKTKRDTGRRVFIIFTVGVGPLFILKLSVLYNSLENSIIFR
jgi:hypothetical protein